MDTYQGQFDFVNFATQNHDFDPGFSSQNVFWTVVLPNDSVVVNPGTGAAELHVHDLHIRDYSNFPNAAALGPYVDATVSFDVVWGGPASPAVRVRDEANGFAGDFRENQATVVFSATEAGLTFTTDPVSTQTSVFAEVGHERNGIFFPQGRGG